MNVGSSVPQTLPLLPQEPTFGCSTTSVATGQEETHAPQQAISTNRSDRRKRPGRLKIDEKTGRFTTRFRNKICGRLSTPIGSKQRENRSTAIRRRDDWLLAYVHRRNHRRRADILASDQRRRHANTARCTCHERAGVAKLAGGSSPKCAGPCQRRQGNLSSGLRRDGAHRPGGISDDVQLVRRGAIHPPI